MSLKVCKKSRRKNPVSSQTIG